MLKYYLHFNSNLKKHLKQSTSILNNNLNLFYRLKSTKIKKNDDYSKTLNLPNSGKFELSMKKICENEEQIKKVCQSTFPFDF